MRAINHEPQKAIALWRFDCSSMAGTNERTARDMKDGTRSVELIIYYGLVDMFVGPLSRSLLWSRFYAII